MLYTLQVSAQAPTQFKIQVMTDNTVPTSVTGEAGWTYLGCYDTVEKLEAALEPYLHMERTT